LKNYQQHPDTGVYWSEAIYVHSKLMIVDDRQAIIGSANINDRSQLGTRDSEVCILYTEKYDKFKRPGFVKTLRTSLMSRFLGVSEEEFSKFEPVWSNAFFSTWKNTAKRNEQIYWSVFQCTPHDSIKTDKELQRLKKQKNEDKVNGIYPYMTENLKKIQGYLVRMPLHFLENDDLHPKTVNSVPLPVNLFT